MHIRLAPAQNPFLTGIQVCSSRKTLENCNGAVWIPVVQVDGAIDADGPPLTAEGSPAEGFRLVDYKNLKTS